MPSREKCRNDARPRDATVFPNPTALSAKLPSASRTQRRATVATITCARLVWGRERRADNGAPVAHCREVPSRSDCRDHRTNGSTNGSTNGPRSSFPDCYTSPESTMLKKKTLVATLVVLAVVIVAAVVMHRRRQCKSNADCKLGTTYCAQNKCRPMKPRQHIGDLVGFIDTQKGWFDIQGQGVSNDYCRWMGERSKPVFTCALAGSSDPLGTALTDAQAEALRPTCKDHPSCTRPAPHFD
jgi:hypothetical protein